MKFKITLTNATTDSECQTSSGQTTEQPAQERDGYGGKDTEDRAKWRR